MTIGTGIVVSVAIICVTFLAFVGVAVHFAKNK